MQQNHDLAFRHSPDKGHRLLRKLLELGVSLPRWGSHNGTPPPPFDSLKFHTHTNLQDFADFRAASGMDSNGNRWWRETQPLDLTKSTSAKSHSAARVWLRLHVSHQDAATHSQLLIVYPQATQLPNRNAVCDPEVARELLYILGWINGLKMSMEKTAQSLKEASDELELHLLKEFKEDVRREREAVARDRTASSHMDVDNLTE